MHPFNYDRFQNLMKKQGFEAAILSNPATLTWLTGYAPPIQTGPSPFEGGPALGWWQGGELTLILSDAEAGGAAACGVQVRDYLSYSIDEPMEGLQRQATALQAFLSSIPTLKGKVAVERNFMPVVLAHAFHDTLPDVTREHIDGAFDALRAVKSPEELEKIKASLHLCDLAQAYVAEHATPGMSEIELWCGIKSAIEKEAATRVPVLADVVAGLRTADIGGLPGDYILQPGDTVLTDIVPRLNGYWGDNAGAHFLGEPRAEMKKIYAVVRATLRKGVESVRPGMKACDLDRQLRAEIQSQGYTPYPHHSGHGVGAAYHEEPRLVPYNDMKLEPGMVIALEPGIYLPGVGGVRLEDVVLVTTDGCQLLTSHLSNK